MLNFSNKVSAFFRGDAWDVANTPFPQHFQRQNQCNPSGDDTGEEVLLYF